MENWNGQPKLILVEGLDCQLFIIRAIAKKFPDTKSEEVFVQDFGKVGLARTLKLLKKNNFKHLFIVIDAETKKYESARDSLESILRENSYLNSENFSVDYFIIGKEEFGGNLEELCLMSIFDKTALEKTENFVAEFSVKTPHKSKLAAYLAVAKKQGNEERGGEFAAMKLGEAANAGAFDWTHASLEKFLDKLGGFLII